MVRVHCQNLRTKVNLNDNLLCERYAKVSSNNGLFKTNSTRTVRDIKDAFGIWNLKSNDFQVILRNSKNQIRYKDYTYLKSEVFLY